MLLSRSLLAPFSLSLSFVIASSMVFGAGCASASADAEEDAASSDESELKVNLGSTDNGKTVSAKAGDQIVVKLPGLGTAGYEWNVVSSGSLSTPRKRSIAPRGGSGVGASASEEFTWSTAGARGTDTLRLEQKRSWEPSPIRTYAVTVRFGNAPAPTRVSCSVAGGQCVGLAPGNCAGSIGDARSYDCGSGIGVMCCLP